MNTSVLEELGLSNAEAKIYLALLGLGSSKTGDIIDRTKLQSSTVYHVLGSLVEKGLVSYVLKGKIKFYQAEDPNSFLLFLEEKKRKLNEILPELRRKERLSKQKQTAKVYEGLKGVKGWKAFGIRRFEESVSASANALMLTANHPRETFKENVISYVETWFFLNSLANLSAKKSGSGCL